MFYFTIRKLFTVLRKEFNRIDIVTDENQSFVLSVLMQQEANKSGSNYDKVLERLTAVLWIWPFGSVTLSSILGYYKHDKLALQWGRTAVRGNIVAIGKDVQICTSLSSQLYVLWNNPMIYLDVVVATNASWFIENYLMKYKGANIS